MTSRFKTRKLLSALAISIAIFVPSYSAYTLDPKCVEDVLSKAVNPTLSLKKISKATDWGPRVVVKAQENTRDFDQIKDIAILQYNVENLVRSVGLHAPHPQTGLFTKNGRQFQILMPESAKDPAQVAGVADAIKRSNPDIAFLEEVEDIGELKNFNSKYLSDQYSPILIEGNDARGIDIGILVKKDLPFDVEVQSYKNVARVQSDEPVFSRDLPVVIFRKKGSSPDSPPVMVMAGTHFKSQRSIPGDDRAVNFRKEQAEAAAQIMNAYKSSPSFLIGDWNADIRQGTEFNPLWQNAGLKDSFDLAPADHSLPTNQRITQTFHPKGGASIYSQLDSVSGNKVVQDHHLVEEAKVVPYLDDQGNPRRLPQSYQEREENPSDHLPVRVVIDFQKIRQLFLGKP